MLLAVLLQLGDTFEAHPGPAATLPTWLGFTRPRNSTGHWLASQDEYIAKND